MFQALWHHLLLPGCEAQVQSPDDEVEPHSQFSSLPDTVLTATG